MEIASPPEISLGRLQEFVIGWARKSPRFRERVASMMAPPGVFIARLPGSERLRFKVDRRDLMLWPFFSTGGFDLGEVPFVQGLLAEGDTFVDVGANWGLFTLLASEKVGDSGRVFAIEADPRIYPRLQYNIAINSLKNVETDDTAVASGPGTLEFVVCSADQFNQGLSHLRGRVEPGDPRSTRSKMQSSAGNIIRKSADSIDEILDRAGIGRVDLIKIDIEGTEQLALAGMNSGLTSQRYRRIFIEIHLKQLREYESSFDSIADSLKRHGYTLLHYRDHCLRELVLEECTEPRPLILALAPSEQPMTPDRSTRTET